MPRKVRELVRDLKNLDGILIGKKARIVFKHPKLAASKWKGRV
jgi:hypothetical protein